MGCSSSANVIERACLEATYKLDKLPLGHGSFGVVFKGVEKDTGKTVAVKQIAKVDCARYCLNCEVDIMRRFSCNKHITRFITSYETASHLQIVMEYVGGGDLFTVLEQIGTYSEKDAAEYTRSMAAALKYLHHNCVAHRDVKPENLLLRCYGRGELKLCDFGCAKVLKHQDDLMWSACGTWSYAAPEVLKVRITNNGSYTLRCDLFAVGVILFFLLAGYHPFDVDGRRTSDEIQSYVCSGHWSFEDASWSSVDPSSKEIVASLLEINPSKRFTAEQLLSHKWVDGFRCSTRRSRRISSHRECIQMQDAGTSRKSPKSPSMDTSNELARIDMSKNDGHRESARAYGEESATIVPEPWPGNVCTHDLKLGRVSMESLASTATPSESVSISPPCSTSLAELARDSKQKGQPLSKNLSKSLKDSARYSNRRGKPSSTRARKSSKFSTRDSKRGVDGYIVIDLVPLRNAKCKMRESKQKGNKMRQSAQPHTAIGPNDSSGAFQLESGSAHVLRRTSGQSDAYSDFFDAEITRSYDFSVPSGSVASAASYCCSEVPFREANTFDVADVIRYKNPTGRSASTLTENGNMHRIVVGSLMAKVGHEDGQPKREESKGRVHATGRKSNSNFRVETDRKVSVSFRRDGKKGANPLRKRPSRIKKQLALKTRDGGRGLGKLGSEAWFF